jgi:N-methylhydantoinase B
MHGDGVGPYKTMLHADNKSVPVETVEALYPVLVERIAWREDSAGPGRNRGGLGVDKTYRVLAPVRAFVGFERYDCPPWGLSGGLAGKPGYVELENMSGERRQLVKGSGIPMQIGERMISHSGSGGGFGPPWERDVERVIEDVRAGYVTVAAARADYGVVITDDCAVDAAETRRLREQLRRSSTARPQHTSPAETRNR